jgi:hypothetical protein
VNIIGSLLIAIAALFFWAIICLHRTSDERFKLIDRIAEAIRASGYTANYWTAFDSLSFDRHLWLRLTFRNPMKYYIGLPEGA